MDFIFWLRQKRNSKRKIITARITLLSKRKDFSTGIEIDPKDWMGNEFLIRNNSELHFTYNETLALIKSDVLHAFNTLLRNKEKITVSSIYQRYISDKKILFDIPSKPKKEPSLMEILMLGMKRKFEQVGVKIKKSSYDRYEDYQLNLMSFLKRENIDPWKMPITDLSLDLCNRFIKTLVTVDGKAPTTANKHKEILRIIVNTAHYEADGWRLKLLTKDLNKHKEPLPDKTHLTVDEIKMIEQYPFVGKLDRTRDILLMLCEIGQHIGDYTKIVQRGKIFQDEDGDSWIIMQRVKTDVSFEIHLSKRALQIIKKHGGLHNLPIISDQRVNDYLKLIAHYTGIEKNLTTKIGRKSFSSYYLNKKKIDRKTVAKMMGLKNDKYLEHYAEEDLSTMKHYWKKSS